MQFSAFGEKFTQHSGILQLMDDLGDALKSDKPVNMLGGGNPARIAEVNAVFANVFSKLAAEHAVENIGNYSNPQGDAALIDALTAFLNREYGWNLNADNIALTNGSQNAFFYLFNLFGGKFNLSDGLSTEKAILLPLAPEYIGYADVHVEGQHLFPSNPKSKRSNTKAKQASSNTAWTLTHWKACPNSRRAKSARFAVRAQPIRPATC